MTDKTPDQSNDTLQKRDKLEEQLRDNLPQLFKMMQDSTVMGLFYEYVVKIVSNKATDVDFFKNKTNIKYITLGICLLFASTLIGMLSYFLFYVMFFFSSLKCILWLFEGYSPTPTDQVDGQIQSNLTKTTYVSETSASDVLEYYVVPIFIVLVLYPMAYIPIPFVPFIVYTLSVTLCLACMTNRSYRRQFCTFARNIFTNKQSRNEKGEYVPGKEGEFHRFLQTLCYSMECINLSTFNITHTPIAIFNKLNSAESVSDAMGILTSGLLVNTDAEKTKREIYRKQYSDVSNSKSDKSINFSTSSDIMDDEFDEDM